MRLPWMSDAMAVRIALELIRISDTEVRAQVQEAEANAAQIQARLAFGAGAAFDIDRVPEVANAKASDDPAQADFARARMLSEKQLLSAAGDGLGERFADDLRRTHPEVDVVVHRGGQSDFPLVLGVE